MPSVIINSFNVLAQSTPGKGLGWIDALMVVAYLALTAFIIRWSSRRQNDAEDFFLGGRSMPWLAVGLSIMATLLSTITYLGVPGEMIKNGVAFFATYLAIPFAAIVIGWFWIPFFMRLRMTSAYEFLRSRFDEKAQLLAGILFLMLRLGWIAMVVYTASLAMVGMTSNHLKTVFGLVGLAGIKPIVVVIIAVGVAATIYTWLGGIRAVIWTDVLQSIMLFGGVFIIIIFVMGKTGTTPADWWTKASSLRETSGHTKPIVFSWSIFERTTVVTAMLHMFFYLLCTHGADQVVLQRYFSTPTVSAARRSFLVSIISTICIGSLLGLSGLALLYYYLENPTRLPSDLSPLRDADKVMPYFYANELIAGFGGLILVSFLCDAMQTLVSGVNSISAVVTRDIMYRRTEHHVRTEGDELRTAKVTSVAVGLFVTGLALVVSFAAQMTVGGKSVNIIDLMGKMFNLYLGPLASLFFIGMFLPRCTSRSTFPAVIISVMLAIFWGWWPEIFRVIGHFVPSVLPLSTKTPSIMMIVFVPCLTAFILAWILSFILETNPDHPGRKYTWWAVMRRSEGSVEMASVTPTGEQAFPVAPPK